MKMWKIVMIIGILSMSVCKKKIKKHNRKKQLIGNMGEPMIMNQPRMIVPQARQVVTPAMNVVSAQYEQHMEPYVEEHHVIEPIRLTTPEYARPKEHIITPAQEIHREQVQSVENQHQYYDSFDPYSGQVVRHEQIVQRPITHFVDTVHQVEQHHIRNLDGTPIGQKVIAYHGLEKRRRRKRKRIL